MFIPGLLGYTFGLLFVIVGLGRSKLYLKNDIEPRGVIFPKYEPVASHGDPFQARFSKKTTPIFKYMLRNVELKLDF